LTTSPFPDTIVETIGRTTMRKVYVEVTSRIIMNMDDGIEVNEVIENMDYDFTPMTEGVDFEDMEIRGHEVTDSK